jgi:hypothetical protein
MTLAGGQFGRIAGVRKRSWNRGVERSEAVCGVEGVGLCQYNGDHFLQTYFALYLDCTREGTLACEVRLENR